MAFGIDGKLNPLEEEDKAKAGPNKWFVQNPLLPRTVDPINNKGRVFIAVSLIIGLGLLALLAVVMTQDSLKAYRWPCIILFFVVAIILRIIAYKKTYYRNPSDIHMRKIDNQSDNDPKNPVG